MLQTNVHEFFQFFRRPCPANRVMRITKKEQLGFRCDLLFEIFEIHFESTIFDFQRIDDRDPFKWTYDVGENEMNGCLENDFISFLGKGLDQALERRIDCHAVCKSLSLDPPAIVPLKPAKDRLIVGIPFIRISVNTVYLHLRNL